MDKPRAPAVGVDALRTVVEEAALAGTRRAHVNLLRLREMAQAALDAPAAHASAEGAQGAVATAGPSLEEALCGDIGEHWHCVRPKGHEATDRPMHVYERCKDKGGVCAVLRRGGR